MLLAESYPPTVTATAVWLNEMGLDLTLHRHQAYRTARGETILTVSQLYPVPDVATFEIAPRSRGTSALSAAGPVLPWTESDLADLAEIANATMLAILDLCAAQPDTWIVSGEVWDHAGVTSKSGTGQLGGFGITVKNRFKRSNPPYDRRWGGDSAEYRCRRTLRRSGWQSVRPVRPSRKIRRTGSQISHRYARPSSAG